VVVNLGEPVVLVSSAEFVLKSSHVRRTLEQRLIDDIRLALRKSNIYDFTIGKVAGRIVVGGISEAESAARVIARIFGVAYAIPAIKVEGSTDSVLSAIRQTAMDSLGVGQTFAVRCHRSALNPVSTRDVEKEGGSQILDALAERKVRVNLTEPDVLISVDFSAKEAYLFTTRIPGSGGLPLSSEWKMLAIMDSPLALLAAYVMMRRGCLTQLLIPCSGVDIRFNAERQIAQATKLRDFVTRERYSGYILDLDALPHAASLIRRIGVEFASQRRFRGVVFADARGPIGSISFLTQRSRDLGIPIFQPLIGFGETEVIELAQLLSVEWRESSDAPVEIESKENLDSLSLPIKEVSL